MKEQIEQLLQRHSPLPGLVAWMARVKDGKTVSQNLTSRFDPETIEWSLKIITLMADLLREQELPSETLSMGFEQARLCVGFRSDGAFLALLVLNNAETKAPSERLLAEFQKS